jgi:hypothetical protein
MAAGVTAIKVNLREDVTTGVAAGINDTGGQLTAVEKSRRSKIS